MNQTQAKHTPGPRVEEVWAGPYQPCKAENGRAYLLNAVYSALHCGCTVIGNGTLPDPLSVKLCPKHSATDELLEACKAILAGFDAGVFVRNISKDGTSEWHARLLPHLAALAKPKPQSRKPKGKH